MSKKSTTPKHLLPCRGCGDTSLRGSGTVYCWRCSRDKKAGGRNGNTCNLMGYTIVHWPDHPGSYDNGYVLEHHLVMEEKLGRLLTRKEVVHHINGIRNDNRPENLQIFASNADHSRHHAELRNRSRGKRDSN